MDVRLKNLRHLLKEQSLDAALITSIPNIIYLTGYAGFLVEERDAYVVITKDHAYLFTNSLYFEEVKHEVKHMMVTQLSRTNSFTHSLKQLFTSQVRIVGIEEHNLTAAEYQKLSSLSVELQAIDLKNLRIKKDAKELDALEKACHIGDMAFTYILTKIKPGVSEKEIAHKLDLFTKQHNADPSFRAIVAFGKNAAIPHHLSNDAVLEPNTCVLLDFGVKWENYCSDMTRTVFVGNASKDHKKVYQTVHEAQQRAITFIQGKLTAGKTVSGSEADKVARDYIATQGYGEFPHRLGHGIGLEVHESPSLFPAAKEHFDSNMVFTIEPGIYLAGDMGVRIEDDFVISNNTLIQLTKASRELIELPL